MSRVRDYGELVSRLRALPSRQWRVRRVGEVWGYPFFCVERRVSGRAPTVLLSGGMHGEEPAGVEGVLRWLVSDAWRRDRVNWFVLPCINPFGWERHRRTNAQRRDINRQFRARSDCPEAELVKRLLGGRRFVFSMEFHEDWEARGYYLYEGRPAPPYVGEKIVRAVSRLLPINRTAEVDGSRTTGHGLIRRAVDVRALNRRRRWPMAYWLLRHCTDHVLGSETPQTVPLARRASAHTLALATALRGLLR